MTSVSVLQSVASWIPRIGAVLLIALALILGVKMLTGGINTRALLHVKGGRRAGALSPTRVQLLVFTLGSLMTYFARVVATRTSGTLPDVPAAWLAVGGASQSLYLGAKLWALLKS